MMNKQQFASGAEGTIVQTYRPIEELVPAEWSEGDVVANGIRQHYYRTGRGGEKPPLLLLHGFNEYGLTWLRVARELEGDYDCIMLDARGHGRSEGIAGGFSSRLLVGDVVGVIDALKLGSPRIIGFSQGGTTALRLAATYPEIVHSFIFEGWGENANRGEGASAANLANSEGYRAWYNSWLAWLEELSTLNHQERMVAALPQLLPMTGGTLLREEEYVPSVEAYVLFSLELARESIKLWANVDTETPTELLQRVRCPALIMKHGWSFPLPGTQPAVREVAEEQANVRIVSFENTGHLIRRVAFEQFMGLMREFLGRD